MNTAFPERNRERSGQGAFTLMELVVVLATIGLLAATLLPTFANKAERTKRAACQNNLRQLAAGMTIYAANNAGHIIKAKFSAGVSAQIVLDSSEAVAAGTVGLQVRSNAPAWTCPDRPGLPVYDAGYANWTIGYQYFGGITTWRNPAGSFPSCSPTNLTLARPHWTLAADAVMKIGGAWGGGGSEFVYQNMPPHHAADSLIPEGGNQAFVDGSVRWVPFEQMYFLHSWSTSSRVAFFYQDPKDFPASLRAMLPSLRAAP